MSSSEPKFEEIGAAFEAVVQMDRRLLTERQQLWVAFRAGAAWSIRNTQHGLDAIPGTNRKERT